MLDSDEIRKIEGRVINIQHYCYHDGPGVRTTVFVKGCSLHCKWCGNPESIAPGKEFSFDKKECVGVKFCGKCLKAPFPEGMFTAAANETDPPIISWEKAKDWKPEYNRLCPVGALSVYGEDTTVGAVMDEVDKDYSFYAGSGGGITVSGGEPLLQPDFTKGLLEVAHAHGYTTAIESAFNVPWQNVEQVLPHVDFVLHDIKLMDPVKHKEWTKVTNERALTNLEKAYTLYPDKKFIARTPLIPGVNDEEQAIDQVLDFILPHKNVIKYELMPYHRLGSGKYESLGLDYPMGDTPSVDPKHLAYLREKIENAFQKRT